MGVAHGLLRPYDEASTAGVWNDCWAGARSAGARACRMANDTAQAPPSAPASTKSLASSNTPPFGFDAAAAGDLVGGHGRRLRGRRVTVVDEYPAVLGDTIFQHCGGNLYLDHRHLVSCARAVSRHSARRRRCWQTPWRARRAVRWFVAPAPASAHAPQLAPAVAGTPARPPARHGHRHRSRGGLRRHVQRAQSAARCKNTPPAAPKAKYTQAKMPASGTRTNTATPSAA